jgi:hypothetical protein
MKLLILNQSLEAEPAPEIRDIECFRKIIIRDRDKYKKTCKKELCYIFHMADNTSSYSNFPEKERHAHLANDVFQDKDWKSDNIIIECIELYKKLNVTPSEKLVVTLNETLHKTDKIIRALIEQMEENLTNETHKQAIIKMGNAVKTGVQVTVDDINALMDVGKRVPSLLKELESLEQRIKNEKQLNVKARGNTEVSNREK